MPKKMFFLLIVFNFIILTACDPYVRKYPINQFNSKWECQNPSFFYYVNGYGENFAEVEINGETKYFGFGFCSETADALKYELNEENQFIATGEIYFYGTGKYGKNKFTVIIDKETDKLFNGKYDKLIFKRVEGKWDGSPVSFIPGVE